MAFCFLLLTDNFEKTIMNSNLGAPNFIKKGGHTLNYLSIANHSFVYLVAAMVIGSVAVSAILFIRMAWKRGLELGINRRVLRDTVKSSAFLSIGPTVPIIIALMVMFPILGVPWPWMRLSVIGSAPYELMTAEVGAKSMGVAGLGGTGYTAQVFANSIFLMAILPLDVMFFNLFFLKKYSNKLEHIKEKDPAWMEIFSYCLFLGLLSAFAGDTLVKGVVQTATFFGAFGIMMSIGVLIKRFKMEWLKSYALVFSMIGGMALSVLFTGMF